MNRKGWERISFAEVIDFQEGPGIMAYDFRPTGVPLIRLKGLEAGGSILEGCDFLDPLMVERRWSHFRLREGDVLLSTSASLGRIAEVPPAGVGSVAYTGLIRMRPRNERVFRPFIRYILEGPDFQRQIEEMGVGSVIRHFGPSHLKQMTLRLPPERAQRTIATVLKSLDDKIESNRKASRTLEETARTLFRSWFVDFDPVRANSEQRKSGVHAQNSNLFPESLAPSVLGEIPEGWRASQFSDSFKLEMGQSPPGTSYNQTGDGLPFFQGSTDFGFRFPTRRVFCSAPKRFAEPGDTLISVRAPVGAQNMASARAAIGRGVAAMRHKSGSLSYTYYSIDSGAHILKKFNAEGTVFGSIGKSDFSKLLWLSPPQPVIDAFESLIRPLDLKIEKLEVESGTLIQLRNSLLPRLMNGDLAVTNASGF